MINAVPTTSGPRRPIRSIAVFCAASHTTATRFTQAAADLGRAIGDAGWTLVYGGNYTGLMGVLADGARESDGRVIGITPQFFLDKGIGDHRCDQLIVSTDMRDRKALIEKHGDAFVAIPGGLGTLDEFFDALVSRSLGFHEKPIVMLNIDGFYDPLLKMIDDAIEHQFIKLRTRKFVQIANTVEQAMQFLIAHGNSDNAK